MNPIPNCITYTVTNNEQLGGQTVQIGIPLYCGSIGPTYDLPPQTSVDICVSATSAVNGGMSFTPLISTLEVFISNINECQN